MISSLCLRSSARAVAASSPRAAFLEALQCELPWPSPCSSQLPETPVLNLSVVSFWLGRKGGAGLQWQNLDSLLAGWCQPWFSQGLATHQSHNICLSQSWTDPGRHPSSASEELEQTEAPLFSLGFLPIPAARARAAVCDLLKDIAHPRPLLSACLCGSCVTNGPWDGAAGDRAGDRKGSGQERAEKLVLICFGPLWQNKTFVSSACLSPLSDTKCKVWGPLVVLALIWVISELVFVSRAHLSLIAGGRSVTLSARAVNLSLSTTCFALCRTCCLLIL